MAKKQSFSDKANKKMHEDVCPVCETPKARVKFTKAVKTEKGWRFRTNNVGVCKCNHAEVYG